MWRKPILQAGIILGLTLTLAVSDANARQNSGTAYDVSAFGFKVGELRINNRLDAQSYSVAARFSTTGLVGMLRNMGFSMQANGRRKGASFSPLRYRENVNTGRRTSSAQMRYVRGVPSLSGGKVSDGEAAPLDPARQGGTIDPLTALFMVLRDQPAASLCQLDEQMFDGARRTRILLESKTGAGQAVTCSGRFQRVAGYSDADLTDRGFVPLQVTYAAGPGGAMQAQDVQLQTSYGLIALKRQ